MKHRPALTGLLALTLALSCKSEPGDGVASVLLVASVEVQPGITDVVVGQTRQLTATAKTSSGITIPGRNAVWSSTDPSIASVSGAGLVTGVALGGPVRIRATIDGVVGDALLSVRPVPIDRITVSPPNSGVLVGAGVQLTATAFDAAGATLGAREFRWESSAPAIAAVTTQGIVIGLAQGGPVTISAIAEGKTGTALVSVATRPATRLAFTQQPGASTAGQTVTPLVQVALQDDLLTTVVGASNPVTVALAANPGGATLAGATTVNPVNGIASFTTLSLNRVGTGYTLLVTSPGLSPSISNPFNVTAGSANELIFSTAPPSSAQSGVPFAPQPVVQLVDAGGNPVAQPGVVVTAAIASGGGALGGASTATTNAAGVAGFSSLSITGAAGTYTLSFTAPGIAPLVSGPVALGSGALSSLAIATQPTSSAQSGVPLSQQPAIQLKDASGNNVAQAGVAITAAIASGGGALGGATTVTTNSAGLAQFASLAINGPSGTYTLRFTAPGVTGVTSASIILGAGAPTQLAITTQPSSAASSGVAFGQQPSVQIRDGSGNPVAVSGVQVTAAISSGGGSLTGTTTITTNASGNAVFGNLAISGPVGSYTLTFTSSGLTSAVSATITLSAGSAAQLGLVTQASAGAASGVAFSQQPVVQVRDAAGNSVAQGGVLVTATIASGPGGATLGGTTTASTGGFGAATFTNLSIAGPSGTYTLQFTSPGLTSVTSGGVTLGAGAGTQLTISTQPSSTAQSGAAFAQQPAVQLRDAANNPVAQAGVVVTATIASGGGTLGGTSTATTSASGLATFSNLSITGVVGARTLAFAAPGLTAATSSTITVSAGAATQLSMASQPSNLAQSGVAFAQQPSVQLRDAAGNPVSVAGVNITAAIASGGGTLGGTATVATNAAGLATFAGLSITGTAGDRTLGFSSPGLTVTTSSVITITAGAASQLAITTPPSGTAQSGAAFAQQPVIQLRDAANNPVAQAGVVVTSTIQTGAGSLGGTLSATTNGSGVATFSNLSITGTIGDRTLLFAAAGYVSVASGTITITAGPATQLTITTQPSATAQSGAAFAQQPVLQLRDASGNPASQTGIVVTAVLATGGGTLGGTLTATTSASGVATFTNLSITGAAGDRTLGFSATGLTGTTSNAISITSGGATQLGITTQPSATAQSGAAFGQQPVIQLRDGANTPVSQAGVVVTAAIASGGGTLGGTLTATTNASGVATFTDLSITGTVGNRTLGFSAPSLTGATSGPINITAGAAAIISANSVTSQSAPVSTAVSAPPSVKVTDTGTNPIAGVAVTFAVTAGGGTVVPAGPATVTTNASGIATATSWTLGPTTGTGNNTVTAAAAGLAGSPVSFTASGTVGTPAEITYFAEPSSTATNGVPFSIQPALRLRDANGNNIMGATITATITGGPPGAHLIGSVTAVTANNGRATFSGLGLAGPVGSYSLTFTANGGALSSTASSIALSAGAAAIIAANSTTSQSATAGTAVSAPPSVKVTDTGGNPIAGVAVTFAVASGGGTVVPAGPTTVATSASGIATATSWTLGPAAGTNNNTVTATASGLTGSPVTFTASGTAASPSQTTYSSQPSTSASRSRPLPTLTTAASGAITLLP